MTVPAAKLTESAMLSVYDGQAAIGFVIRRGPAGAESFTAEGGSLGLFRTVDAAATALWKHAHKQPISNTD
jgi:hypothetical protein